MTEIHDGHRTITRTEAIAKAILEELRKRRALIDDNASLAEMTITVYLHDNPDCVRSTRVEEHTRYDWRRRRS